MGTLSKTRWQEAEQLCRQVTDDDPNDPDGWHLLGLIAARRAAKS